MSREQTHSIFRCSFLDTPSGMWQVLHKKPMIIIDTVVWTNKSIATITTSFLVFFCKLRHLLSKSWQRSSSIRLLIPAMGCIASSSIWPTFFTFCFNVVNKKSTANCPIFPIETQGYEKRKVLIKNLMTSLLLLLCNNFQWIESLAHFSFKAKVYSEPCQTSKME